MNQKFLSALPLVLVLSGSALAATGEVRITHDVMSVEVLHGGKPVVIERNQDNDNTLDPFYSMTSRPCPPYCVQPISLHPNVETIGELEVINYLKRQSKGENVLVIDSREGKRPSLTGVVPGAVNIPWLELHPESSSAEKIADILEMRFGAVYEGKLWNFENAKTLVFYCNGPWCGQSSTNIKQLLALGYPAIKLKWYRGGMQEWKMFGLTTVPPLEAAKP